ncbi:MAG: hypothetical protein OEY28_06560 [Nitrospira sp.]|nr:hypothetical protein [Nitrospira sp.]
MNAQKILWLVVAMAAYSNVGAVWAYDTGPAVNPVDPCLKISVSAFKPIPFSRETNNVEVPPNSEFSFLISKEAAPNSVKVTIKGESVPVTVHPQLNGALIKGKLPPSVKGKYIRVEIAAKGPSGCDRLDGWLLKVGN